MKFRYLLFTILLLVFSESLFKTPLQNLSIFLKLLFTLYFTYLFFFHFLFYNVNIPFYSKSYLLILFFLPTFYSYISYVIFNQSFLNGLALNFNQYGFLIILFFYRNNYFNQNIIKKIILITGILSFIILSITKIYFNNYLFIVDSFMGSTKYLYSIKLISIPLITWTSFILFFDYLETNKIKNLIISLLFFLFPIFFNNARGYTISILILFLFIFFKKKYYLNIKNLVFIIIFTLFLFYTNIIKTKFLIFKEIFYSYKYLNNNDDQSSLFRFFEVRDVLIYIAKYPFFGVGSLNDIITKNYISKYLYPSDIGIVGLLYNFGFIGLFIYSYQIIVLRKIYKTKIFISNSFSKATFYYLIFFIIESLFTGNLVYKISYITLLTSIILFINFEYDKEKI